MQTSQDLIQEIILRSDNQFAAWVRCATTCMPAPGQYLSAWAEDDPHSPLSTIIYAGKVAGDRFLALPPIPSTWQPGTRLNLLGPLGHGFDLPDNTSRIALAAFGTSCERLLPLADQALERGAAVALFTDSPIPALPAAMEVNPLTSLAEALAWAEYLAVDVDRKTLATLRARLNLLPGERLSCQAQVLIMVDMPCVGLATCGACVVPGLRSPLFACTSGPVFSFDEIEW